MAEIWNLGGICFLHAAFQLIIIAPATKLPKKICRMQSRTEAL